MILACFLDECSSRTVVFASHPSILGIEIPEFSIPNAREQHRPGDQQPAIVQFSDHIVLEYRGKTGEVVPVFVDDVKTAHRLRAISSWRLYPNRPGQERYIRRNIRIGKSVATEYAHDFLFGASIGADGVKIRVTPRDGNYLNLRAVNFQKPQPRSNDEITKFLMLITPAIWAEMLGKAKRALKDPAKAQEAIGATLDHVMAYLKAGRVSFESDEKFINWVFTTLERQIRRHKVGSHVVLNRDELRMRTVFVSESIQNISAGKYLGPAAEPNSGSAASSLRAERLDDRPAQSTKCPLPEQDRSRDDET